MSPATLRQFSVLAAANLSLSWVCPNKRPRASSLKQEKRVLSQLRKPKSQTKLLWATPPPLASL